MNSADMLCMILNSPEMEPFRGFTSLSLPFCLDDGRAAAFLAIKADDHSSMRAVGLFVMEGERCRFEKAQWEMADQSGSGEDDLFAEVQAWETDEETMKEPGAYGRVMEAFYSDFDIAREAVFTEADDLPDETRAAVTRYLSKLCAFSDRLSQAGYVHFCRQFLEWCLDVYYYENTIC